MISLPELPYPYEALSPTISAETMRTHHDKHHAKYIENTNKMAGENGLDGRSLEDMIAEARSRKLTKLFNNAAQSWNHAFFWDCMTPSRRDPQGELAAAIASTFGDLAGLQKKFVEEGVGHFGSGWAWLAAEGANLVILSTHDGDTLADAKRTPLLVCDVWEHAYYLDYKQDRQSFVERWFNQVANWEFAEAQYQAAKSGGKAWTFA